MQLAGKCVVIVGLGASGVAAAKLCAKRGAKTIGLDNKSEVGDEVRALENDNIQLALGSNDATDLSRADLIVVSPGVANFAELEKAEKSGIETIGEVELAVRCLSRETPVVAIGGTNGKSTTTTLVAELLTASGKKVFAGGNLGEPLASHVDEPFDVIVLEVSSFQMERVREFHPRAAALLNVTADHLDRYASMEAYAHAKGNCFVRQTTADIAVAPVGDELCLAEARRGKGRLVAFGPSGDVDITADAIIDRMTNQMFSRQEIALVGGHNALNVAAAIATVSPFGVSQDVIAKVLKEFRGLDHRMSFVTESRGVRYYDDSKGTNVGAAVTAVLGATEPKVVLIAGGRDKGGSYEPLVDALKARGRAVVLVGEAADAIANAIGSALPTARATTMAEAVARASEFAVRGDAVLLSPACSSFDMFRDYKHRGDEFAKAARALGRAQGET